MYLTEEEKTLVNEIHPISKHMTYYFGSMGNKLGSDIPALFVDTLTLTLGSVGFDYAYDPEIPIKTKRITVPKSGTVIRYLPCEKIFFKKVKKILDNYCIL